MCRLIGGRIRGLSQLGLYCQSTLAPRFVKESDGPDSTGHLAAAVRDILLGLPLNKRPDSRPGRSSFLSEGGKELETVNPVHHRLNVSTGSC